MNSTEITTAAWDARREVRREDDDELLGFVLPDGPGFVPVAVFGSKLGPVATEDEATAAVASRGLEYLTDPWLLSLPDREIQVRVLEGGPAGVTVQNADYGSGLDLDVTWTVPAPAPTLRRG